MSLWRLIFSSLLVVGISHNAYAKTHVPKPAQKCVQIYYDRSAAGTQKIEGRTYAIYLQNLLGHFVNVQQYINPIDLYHAGDLDKCDASIFIANNFNGIDKIPATFYQDFLTTKRNVVWMKYGISRFTTAQLAKLWSVNYVTVETPDYQHLDADKKPSFYNRFSYKGETFVSYGAFKSPQSTEFNYSSDIVRLQPIDKLTDQYTISWATHSANKDKIPYVLRNKNHWYIADLPFDFITYGDRYFILADLLFDILDEPPVNKGKKYALVRFEDVSAFIAPSIKPMVDMFAKQNIPFAISAIPIFVDPLRVYNFPPYVEMTKSPELLANFKYAQDHGASFIMHGVTHQYNAVKDPFSGVSGEDYEFWDKAKDAPIQEDATMYLLNRLNRGVALMQQANFPIQAWETPHYRASSLDNVIFGQVFIWNVGRVYYVLNKTCYLKPLPIALTYNRAGVNEQANADRAQYLAKLRVINIPGNNNASDQYQPYEVYGDYYGQRLIPENLGNIQPFLSEQVTDTRNVDDILQDAKKYAVLRDAWASFFVHAILLNTKDKNGLAKFPGDTAELQRLISGIKALGYEFIDLKTWTKTHTSTKRPEPIEIDPFSEDCK